MIQNVSLIYETLKKGGMDFFLPHLVYKLYKCQQNNEESLCKITIIQRRGRHGTQKTSGHNLKAKSRQGKMLGSQESNPSINGEAPEGGLQQKRSLQRKLGNRDLGAGGINTIL